MAEQLDVILQLEIAQFTASLQQAAQMVTAFANAITGSIGATAQSFQQQVKQINEIVTVTKQAAQTKKDTAKDESDFQKYIDDLRLENWKRHQQVKAQIAKEDAATAKQAAVDNMAQEKAVGEFIMRQHAERVAQEKKNADAIVRIWAEAEAEKAALQIKAQQRTALRNEVDVLLSQQGVRDLTGGSTAGLTPANQLHFLQEFNALVDQSSQKTGIWDTALARVGTSLKTVGGYFAASFIIGIPFAIAAWGKESVTTALHMQALENTFRAITGSSAKASEELAHLRETATRAGVNFLETANQFRNVEAAARGTSLEGARVRAIFDGVVTASRVMGLSSEQTARALLALEQMISKGTIASEELRKQLSQAIPGAVSIMARAVGVGTENLNNMLKSGELLATDVLPKFGAQLQKEFGPGLDAAAKTAVATFARLGNEIRDISVSTGQAILAALHPVATFLENLLRQAREARNLEGESRAKLGAELRAGKPVVGGPFLPAGLAEGATEAEVAQADRILARMEIIRKVMEDLQKATKGANWWGQMLADPFGALGRNQTEWKNLEQTYLDINKTIEERMRLLKDEANAESGDAGKLTQGGQSLGAVIVEAQKKQKEHVQEFLDLQKQLPEEMRKINAIASMLPTTYEKAEKRLEAVKKLEKEYLDLLEKDPNLRYNKDVQKAFGSVEAQAKALQEEIDARKEKEKLEREAIAEDKRRRAQLKAEEKQRAAEEIRLRDDASVQIAKITQGETEAKLVALDIEVRKMRDAKVNETVITDFEASKRVQIYREEYEKFLQYDKGKLTAIANRVDKQEEIEKLLATTEAKITKTAADDYIAAQDAKLKRLKELRASEAQIAQFTADTLAGAQRIVDEETGKIQKAALREQQKAWRELANTIESTLAGAFENILRGSKNIFEGIRDAFLKLLAKLAADAITNAVIIPILLKLVGSAGFGGGGTGGVGSLGALAVGGQGIPGQGGGSAGTSLLGSGLTLASAGNSISGALGGPSLGLGTGGIGATLAATELGRLPLVGSWFGGPGAGAAGPTTGAGSATLGGLFSTAAIGIAVGEILSMLNKLIGFKGTGSAVAAGAGGGAAAGAFAGTYVFPVIGTGIGAAIGTAVGALGGYLSTLFGKDKTPQFDIKGVQPGRIAYDDVVGLQMTQNFKVLADMHKRLGTDYEDFLKAIDDSINQMFEQVVGQIKGATPEVQRALVDPMNAAFESVAAQITNYPQIGGEKFKDQLEVMIRDFAKIFEQTTSAGVKELTDAMAKIDPVVKAFTQIIDGLLQDIQELQKQQKALDDTLAQSLKNLREKSMTPAEILSARQNEFTDLVAKFNAGDEAAKIQLAPQIASLAEAILDLSTNVFNAQNSFGDLTGIQGAIKQLQESLYTPAQTMAARQTDLANLMDQFRSGDIGVRTVLTPQITQLALQILELAKGVNTLAEQQALLQDFPAQLRSITEALFSPAQTYLSQRSQLTALMAEFRAASPERQLTLEPQVAQLASQILQLARGQDVLGQDPQLLRNTQSELLAAVQEVQDTIANQASQGGSDAAQLQAALERTQAEMIATLREVEYTMAGSIAQNGQQTIQAMWQTAGQITAMDYTMSNGVITAQYYTANGVIGAQYTSAGQLIGTQYAVGGQVIGSTNNVANTVAGWSNYLVYMQNLLIGQVASVRESAWYSYTVLQQALWTEVGLAQQQIGLLINSLYHLETVDAVVANALGVLGQMNARLGNPLRVDLAGSIGEQLQRDTLTTTQQLLYSQRMGTAATIGMLARIAFGLSFEQGLGIGFQYTAYQHGTRSVPFNMMGYLHRGEQVVPEWEARNGGGGKTIQIHVYGGSKDAGEIADAVIAQIEKKSGRLQSTSIQTTRRR